MSVVLRDTPNRYGSPGEPRAAAARGDTHGRARPRPCCRAGSQLPRESGAAEVDRIVTAAEQAAPALFEIGAAGRARLLGTMADEIERDREALVEVSDSETALGEARLRAEVTRACYQLRFFADVVGEGSYIEATIDHASTAPAGPLPDLRRMLYPLGPVAVFGASNFPFAFSVPGQDTASAIAAGCPVVAKAHPAHQVTSERSATALRRAAASCGVPEETFGLVYGLRGWRRTRPASRVRCRRVHRLPTRRGGHCSTSRAHARTRFRFTASSAA